MDALIVLAMLFSIISVIAKALKKAGDRKSGAWPSVGSSGRTRFGTQLEGLEGAIEKAASVFRDEFSPSQRPKPSPVVKTPPQPIARKAAMEDISSSPQRFSVMSPTLSEGDSFQNRGGYVGSLGVASMEGMDLCDPMLNHDRIIAAEPEAGLPMDEEGTVALPVLFTADAVVRGVIMSEVLARPGQREWGRRWKTIT